MEESSLELLSLPSAPSSPFTSLTQPCSPTASYRVRSARSPDPELPLEPGVEGACDGEERQASAEENFSLISESLSVTASDQEKLLLLNKNMELRSVNQQLMKLNAEWDRVYRTATAGLQQRVETLVLENTAAQQLNKRLLLKVEHQQSAREYYEQVLAQELKKNRDLQDYISRLEGSRQKHANAAHTGAHSADQQGRHDFVHVPLPNVASSADVGTSPTPAASCHGSRLRPPGDLPTSSSSSSSRFSPFKSPEAGPPEVGTRRQADGVQDLKEQLEALRCQTQIYEAEFRTEHKDHKNTLQENRRLRRKREEMRQQVALLQEQLKVYEDDFRKERSDKQVLQRLLVKKNSPTKDPVLVHRCNNEINPPGGDKRTQSGERGHRQNHLHCPNCYNGALTNDTFEC